MTPASARTLLFLAAGLQNVLCVQDPNPLFLSPYIHACEYDKARNLSKVEIFQSYGIQAHSGYITVKNETNSNIFFLLTKAQADNDTTPLLLWTQGGPGLSALFGLLLENGPVGFALNDTGYPKFYLRNRTLQKKMNVLYVDLPVGAGFSFTTNQTGYPTKLDNVVDDVMKFFDQFFQLFPEYNARPLYLAGESYGARYSVGIAHRLLNNEGGLSLNLKGIIGGNGFLGPILDIANSASFLYQTSMLTEKGRNEFSANFKIMKKYLTQNATITLGLLFNTIFTDLTKRSPTLFQKLTLYDDHASPIYTQRPFALLACFQFLNVSHEFKTAIHVGRNATFQYNNRLLLETFIGDWLVDITNLTEGLLDKIYVLQYNGHLDTLFPAVNQQAYYNKLKWTGTAKYRKTSRDTWIPYPGYPGFAGYIRKESKFVTALILGMSHYGAVDKPDEVYELITQFVSGSSSGSALFPKLNQALDIMNQF